MHPFKGVFKLFAFFSKKLSSSSSSSFMYFCLSWTNIFSNPATSSTTPIATTMPHRPKPTTAPGASTSSPGDKCIKLLVDAEKRGNQRINEARTQKAKLAKQAKIDAEIEINALRKAREDTIAEKLHKIDDDIEQEKMKYDQGINATLEEYDERVLQVKDMIIDKLLDLVVDIQPEIHHNFKIRKEIEETGSFTHPFDPFHSASY